MPEIAANGINFHYQLLSKGESDTTIVMLHGMLIDNVSSLFYTVAPPVARKLDVLLYDLRGHGKTDRPPTGYKISDAVDDFCAVLDAFEIDEPVYLLGNSYGGTIALAVALAVPERIAGLILVDAHFAIEGWGQSIAKDLELAGFGLDEGDVKTWLDHLSNRKLTRLAASAEELITETSLIDDLATTPPMLPDELRQIAIPTLAIYGEHSDVIDRARDLESLLPACELDVLRDCSHSVLLEATKTVRSLVTEWLDRARTGDLHPGRTRTLDVGEGEGSGEQNRSTVDHYRAELERRKSTEGVTT
jgi:pimeloyl-ACP methyl ester carboxylesterase